MVKGGPLGVHFLIDWYSDISIWRGSFGNYSCTADNRNFFDHDIDFDSEHDIQNLLIIESIRVTSVVERIMLRLRMLDSVMPRSSPRPRPKHRANWRYKWSLKAR